MNLPKILSICVLLALFQTQGAAQKIIAGTFNLRYVNTHDSANLWVNRAPLAASLLRFHQFDLFGTQEGYRSQLNDIQKNLPEFEYYGVGRDDGKEKGEHSAIFYRRDRFRLLNKGDFWLSETPDQPSLGWDATCCHRICTWVQLEDRKTGKKFYFFNTHFDHQGKIARVESSKLILQRINAIAGSEPVLLTGDFNGGRQSEWYLYIANSGVLKDSHTLVNFPYENNGSFHNFGRMLASNEVIDHIFVSKHFLVTRWGILSDSFHGKFPSDHFPVLADINL